MAARQPLRHPRKALPPGEAVPGRRRGRGRPRRAGDDTRGRARRLRRTESGARSERAGGRGSTRR